MQEEINPFDILSGKVVKNHYGTFWFKDCGTNVGDDGYPILNRLHRGNNLPAALWENGTCEWHENGKKHRLDGPASIQADGFEIWYQDGLLYGADGPSMDKGVEGSRYFIQDIEFSKASFERIAKMINLADKNTVDIIVRFRNAFSVKKGKSLLGENGLLIADNFHSETGPAVVWDDGEKWWYIDGIYYNERAFNKKIKCLKKK